MGNYVTLTVIEDKLCLTSQQMPRCLWGLLLFLSRSLGVVWTACALCLCAQADPFFNMETENSLSSAPYAYRAWGTCSALKLVTRGFKLTLTLAAFWFIFLAFLLGIYDPALHALATGSSVFFTMTGSGAGILEKMV